MSIRNHKTENSRLRARVIEQEAQINKLSQQLSSRDEKLAEYRAKEQSISSALEFAVERSTQIDATSYKLYELDIQRSRLLYMSLENALRKVYLKYPELKKGELSRVSSKFRSALYGDEGDKKYPKPPFKSDNAVRKLLSNIISYIDYGHETAIIKRSHAFTDGMGLVSEEYLHTPSRSGFDINEALHPTEQLEDILKSFDLEK